MIKSTPDAFDLASLLIGVDGGGTKTEAVIGRRVRDGTMEILAHGTAGPANLQTVSSAEAWRQCRDAIDQAFGKLGVLPQPIRNAAFAMAGEGSVPHRDAFINEVNRSGLVHSFTVTHDARPLIAGGTPDDCGIALIAGTGSFAYSRMADGSEDRCGGWGFLYGDEGSGYWLGIAGLRAAVNAADGRGEPTALVDAFAAYLDEPLVSQWLPRVRQWEHDQVAHAGRVVCTAAAEGDQVSLRLLEQASCDLAKHLITLWRRQFLGRPVSLVLTGGLLVKHQVIRQAVIDQFTRMGGVVGSCQLVAHPVETVPHLIG